MLNYLKSLTPRKKRWQRAQSLEFEFWKGVSTHGYADQAPDEFIKSGQQKWMLKQLNLLERPLVYWKDKVVVEFGPGPAGIVEYLDAKTKYGVEPLISEYRKCFPHLESSDVQYFDCPGEEASIVPTAIADLLICFNVLDHTYNPSKLLSHLSRIGKPACDLLFQTNVYANIEEVASKSGLHNELHPQSFTKEQVLHLLMAAGFTEKKSHLSKERTPEGELYFLGHFVKKPQHS